MKICFCRAAILASLVAVTCLTSNVAAQTAAGTPSVAVIDLGDVLKSHKRFKAQLEEMKNDVQAFRAYVRQQQTKMQSLADQLKALNADSRDYAQKEKELASLDADLKVQARQKEREFQERDARIRYNTYQEIVQHVSRFAQQYGIQLVIRFERGDIDPAKPQSVAMGLTRSIVFQNQLDITDYIIAQISQPAPASEANRSPQIPTRRR